MAHCENSEENIVLGNFKTKVGDERDEDDAGEYGLREKPERDEELVELARAQNMTLRNSCFQQHPRRLWTWKSP